MLQLLIVACIVALGAAEPEASASPIYVHHDNHDRLEEMRHGHDDDYLNGARKVHVSHDILNKQHKIIENVYSPDYYEPTVILDYRYLKSGGRDYTRGPGGQIIILPHGIRTHENKEHRDYDSLIEFLRLRHLAQTEAKRQRHEDEENSYGRLRNLGVREHAHEHDRKHEDRWWV